MMRTPIVDFVRSYAQKNGVRLHMPGHKGKSFIGCEELDITEISGADVLYSPSGIVDESENNASELFGSAHTFYSTEGSTLAIKAMLAIVTVLRGKDKPLILAARNAHKAFVYAAALLDLDVEWIYSEKAEHLCSCVITPAGLEKALSKLDKKPSAVYLTSPDYLGNVLDIKGLSEVCHKNGVPLLVDNAHGAYFAFLKKNEHPIALGADMCCDSAHKTLPVLTGGAYLHISKNANPKYLKIAREKLALFASTSPSYLILQSLDMANSYIEDGYREKLAVLTDRLERTKRTLRANGYEVSDTEPLKIVLDLSKSDITGTELAQLLRENNIEIEFCDKDYAVMMLTPENSESDILYLEEVLRSVKLCAAEAKELNSPVSIAPARRAMSIREAIFSESESVHISIAEGRICASPTVSCPPAVPIAVAGERINNSHVSAFKYYGIEYVLVVK